MSERDGNLFTREPDERPMHIDMIVGPGRSADNRRFGGLLADLRGHAGLTRADAAAALDVSAEYLRLIEIGRRTPALGKMRSFLDAYQAEGAVRRRQPGGDRPDLLIFAPGSEDPTVVEFTSRIREARGSAVSSSQEEVDRREGWALQEVDFEHLSENHAAELGFVVSFLVRADYRTLLKVRDLLQGEANGDARDYENK